MSPIDPPPPSYGPCSHGAAEPTRLSARGARPGSARWRGWGTKYRGCTQGRTAQSQRAPTPAAPWRVPVRGGPGHFPYWSPGSGRSRCRAGDKWPPARPELVPVVQRPQHRRSRGCPRRRDRRPALAVQWRRGQQPGDVARAGAVAARPRPGLAPGDAGHTLTVTCPWNPGSSAGFVLRVQMASRTTLALMTGSLKTWSARVIQTRSAPCCTAKHETCGRTGIRVLPQLDIGGELSSGRYLIQAGERRHRRCGLLFAQQPTDHPQEVHPGCQQQVP